MAYTNARLCTIMTGITGEIVTGLSFWPVADRYSPSGASPEVTWEGQADTARGVAPLSDQDVTEFLAKINNI